MKTGTLLACTIAACWAGSTFAQVGSEFQVSSYTTYWRGASMDLPTAAMDAAGRERESVRDNDAHLVRAKSMMALVQVTGQTESFASGDDGFHQMGVPWPTPRFTDNLDGTVTDELTGLVWLKNMVCSGTTGDWQTALTDVDLLNFNGTMDFNDCGDTSNAGSHQTDWRLPNIRELQSLIDYGWSPEQLTMPLGHPFSPQFSRPWSSTTRYPGTADAWYVDLDCGELRTVSKTNTSQSTWAVRGGQRAVVPATGQTTSFFTGDDGDLQLGVPYPSPRFTDNLNGTVTDELTGLIWLQFVECSPGREWDAALSAVDELNTAGTMLGHECLDTSNGGSHQTDWRLPNIRELHSLIDFGSGPPALTLGPDGEPFLWVGFPLLSIERYLSSTMLAFSPATGSPDVVWGVDIYSSDMFIKPRTGDVGGIWPVRGDPLNIFADGFESGDMSDWSTTVP